METSQPPGRNRREEEASETEPSRRADGKQHTDVVSEAELSRTMDGDQHSWEGFESDSPRSNGGNRHFDELSEAEIPQSAYENQRPDDEASGTVNPRDANGDRVSDETSETEKSGNTDGNRRVLMARELPMLQPAHGPTAYSRKKPKRQLGVCNAGCPVEIKPHGRLPKPLRRFRGWVKQKLCGRAGRR